MTNEEKRSCFTCEHESLCFLKHRLYDAMLQGDTAWMFEITVRAWTDIFDTLAEACNQYTKMEGAETK